MSPEAKPLTRGETAFVPPPEMKAHSLARSLG